jgi:hypothetical protein
MKLEKHAYSTVVHVSTFVSIIYLNVALLMNLKNKLLFFSFIVWSETESTWYIGH